MSVGFVKFCLGFLKAFRWFPWGFLKVCGVSVGFVRFCVVFEALGRFFQCIVKVTVGFPWLTASKGSVGFLGLCEGFRGVSVGFLYRSCAGP